MTTIPKPIAVTKDTVVLSRADWNRIGAIIEEAQDRAALRASISREKAGEDDALPAALYRRIRVGEHPIRIWREHRGFGLNALTDHAKVARGYLSEIENRKKAGNLVALCRIAEALRVSLDDIVPAVSPNRRRK
jgi:hypothetical protein